MTEWAKPRSREGYSVWPHFPALSAKSLCYLVLVVFLPVMLVRGRSGVCLNGITFLSEFFLLMDTLTFIAMRVSVRLFCGGLALVMVRVRAVLMALLLVRIRRAGSS